MYGPAVDQVLAQENVTDASGASIGLTAANRVYWLLGDNLGSVRDVVDNTGVVAQHYFTDAAYRVLGVERDAVATERRK